MGGLIGAFFEGRVTDFTLIELKTEADFELAIVVEPGDSL
jgi:hypothetical protein